MSTSNIFGEGLTKLLVRAFIIGIAGGAIWQGLKALDLLPRPVASSLAVFVGVALGYWLPPISQSHSLWKWLVWALIIAGLYFVFHYFFLTA